MGWYQAQQDSIEACCRQLVVEGVIEPLSRDGGETRDWNLCELASLVEGHFHEQLDVKNLSEEERLAQECRASHYLVFTWQPDLPPYRVEIGESEARFLLQQDGEWRAVVTARNLGDRLGWDEENLPREPIEMSHCVPGTFAIHLALAGWPLVRSEETWAQRFHWSDAGDPEGLAYKIEIFEAVDRNHGFDVRTPRIPGLQYRDLDDIE